MRALACTDFISSVSWANGLLVLRSGRLRRYVAYNGVMCHAARCFDIGYTQVEHLNVLEITLILITLFIHIFILINL